MRFNVYGKLVVELVRENGGWLAHYLSSDGKRRPAHDVVVPPDTPPDELIRALDDLFHERATPGATVEVISER